jgi:hypothetical protein
MAIDLTIFELNAAMRRTSADLLHACDELRDWAQNYGNAHGEYKKRWAMAFLASDLKTDGQRKAAADEATSDLLIASDMGASMSQAMLEHVRSLRAVLSSLQTEAKGGHEESQYYRTGPQYEK